MDKAELRRLIQGRLVKMTEQQRDEKSRLACKNLIKTDEFKNASVVMLYLSLPHEVDTTPAILYSWQQQKTVVVPKVSWQQRHMIPVEITSLETGIASEASRLRNPVTGVPTPLEDIDLVVTPGRAFDMNGNRLGRGGAYYDRFFSSKGINVIKCGLAFSDQVIDEVPTDPHDQRIDILVTDEGVFDFR